MLKLIYFYKDIKKFLDEAKQGFIYFNLGSNVNSSSLPEEIKSIFLDVFRKLPYKIIWKYEQNLNEKFENIYIGKWLPQQTILGKILFLLNKIYFLQYISNIIVHIISQLIRILNCSFIKEVYKVPKKLLNMECQLLVSQ